MVAVLAIVVALILYGTLYPFAFHFHRLPMHPVLVLLKSWPPGVNRFVLRDAAVNVAIFIPLGVAAFLSFVRRLHPVVSVLAAALLGATLSASIEILQIFDAYRSCSAMDWFCNSIGTLAGAGLAFAFQPQIERLTSPAGRRGAVAGLLLSVCWMGAQLYPLIPLLNRTRLRFALASFWASPVSGVEILAGAAAWFVFGLALGAVWGKLRTETLALTMAVIPLRLLIVDRTVSKGEVLAALLALLLWRITSDKIRPGAAWFLLLTAILLRELAPFNFGRFHGFSWTPFGATIAAERSASVAVILRKAFEYGSMVWLFRARKIGYLTGGVIVAAFLGVLEILQSFLPGRQAEITDSLLALLLGLVLHLIG